MVRIREEEPGDAQAIRFVNLCGFGQSTEADLVDALRSRGVITLSLVAMCNSRLVGHILFSPVSLDRFPDLYAVGLGPMSVLPDFQNRGIGSYLVRTGLDWCRGLSCELVVVLGHPNYYPRFGFVPAREYGLRCEYDVPDEVFMTVRLREGLPDLNGSIVKYQPEFNLTE